jgi:hypothetical protein
MYASMPRATAFSVGLRRLPRDSRVDVLRGIALIMIFIDHLPGNLLSLVTLHSFGFCDAAELFVLLSGFSSMIAYGGSFDRDGVLTGLRRVLLRLVRLYLYQAVLLLVVLAGALLHDLAIEPQEAAAHLHDGLNGLRHGLTLQAQPPGLNILPLYIVLLGLFPLVYGLIRIGPIVALLASAALWLGVNLDPSINLTNWPDGGGWYFDPFAWQFLFVIGTLGAQLIRRYGGDLPRPVWLCVAATGYLGFALIAAAPWEAWGWSSFHPIVLDVPDKTVLAPLRLVNVLAIVVLALGSARFRAVAERPVLRLLVVCGRNSLEVFSLGTVLAMIGQQMFRTYGETVTIQLLTIGVGVALMIALAVALEHARRPTKIPRTRDAREPTAATAILRAKTSPVRRLAWTLSQAAPPADWTG